jgi:hypothetical protein
MQIKSMYPYLSVDWVGTGRHGRSDKDNKEIVNQFCPPKDPDTEEREPPSIDVLVQLGVAGEGLDTQLCSEVIFLCSSKRSISDIQLCGRVARFLEYKGRLIMGHINFDSSSDLRDYTGDRMELFMDSLPPDYGMGEWEDDGMTTGDDDGLIPEEPIVILSDVSLLRIDSDEVELWSKSKVYQHLDDEQRIEIAAKDYLARKRQDAEKLNPESTLKQLQERLQDAVSVLVGLAIHKSHGEARIEKSRVGDLMRQVNTMKARQCGKLDSKNETSLRRHYAWVQRTHTSLVNTQPDRMPAWLR